MRSCAAQLLCTAVLLSSALISAFPAQQAEPQDQNPGQSQLPSSQTGVGGAPAQNSSPANPAARPQQAMPPDGPAANNAPTNPAPKPPVLKHRKRKSTAKKSTLNAQRSAKQSDSKPGRVVVRDGGEKDEAAQLSAAITPAQAQRERATADMLLAVTSANLKRVAGRQLTKDQQVTLDEIHTYMRQAKTARDAGDTHRAHTLAYKARLLSDELAR